MNNNDKNNNNKKSNKFLVVGIIIVIVIVAFVGIIAYLVTNTRDKKENEIAYTDLIKKVSNSEIEKIEMTVGSTSVKVKLKGEEDEKNAIIPNVQAFIEHLQEKIDNGAELELIQNPRNAILGISETLVGLLPTFVILALFLMIFKMQGLRRKRENL